MKIQWLGHSCFKIISQQGTIIFDPFKKGSVPGMADVNDKADLVLCSHNHGDHCGVECVTLTGNPCDVKVECVASWHDDKKGKLRGPNTIHVVLCEGKKIVHLGDLGCLLDEQQIAALKGCDLLLIPVGGHYTINAFEAKQVIEQIQPEYVIPMHYRGKGFGYDVIGTVDEFSVLFDDVENYGDDIVDFACLSHKITILNKNK